MSGDVITGGYAGKILRVNLSTKSISTESINDSFCRKYLGGAGFILYYMLKELPPGVNPLSSENKLIFATGPLTGLHLPGSGRHCIGAKSPLTNTIAKAEVGEFWGAELKFAGYDAVIIEGKADKPVYISIIDEQVNIRDAFHLWGKNTKETQEAIRAELRDERVRVGMIGPAGENQVLYACIMHGLYDAAGRGGLGAVMGSKNLKAVAVRGHKAMSALKPEGVKNLREWVMNDENKGRLRGFSEFGTGGDLKGFETTGNLPVRNFRDGLFPNVGAIDGKAIKNTISVGMDGCFACPVRCKKVVKVEEPYQVDPAYGGPEYETIAALGSDCGIDNLAAIAKGNELCGAYSLDTISTGGAIAFAMECFEKGLLTVKDTDGIDVRFGNYVAMLKLIELIAQRKGIGDMLAEGTVRAAKIIGKSAEKFAMQVKGLELGMHEPRFKAGLGLGFMVSPIGADHCLNIHDSNLLLPSQMKEFHPLGILESIPSDSIGPEKVNLFRLVQLKRILGDSMVLCLFLPYSYEQIADVTGAVTGWDTGVAEQLRVAERILTMARLFNIREGFGEADDILPSRFFQPKTDGFLSNVKLDPAQFDKAKRYYYSLMGWDAQTGVPLPEKVIDLDIKY
jgi:aldehyde:ferredoxin oxidoreductase